MNNREKIEAFAAKHSLVAEFNGEVGFGRECVGLLSGTKYVEYNPINMNTYDYIDEYHDDRFDEIAPENAYHKATCVCVLGTGDSAEKELADWCDSLDELDVTVEDYNTGAIGMQAMFTGSVSKVFKINK